ncbi:helix-turn-helix domain-containing protein [Streptomyces scabiei]|uniref:helix-turn-helix domain-containing protein n=1 Tax=Streptomyces scabiei TaxID=1930 RepID=UPI0038F7DADC
MNDLFNEVNVSESEAAPPTMYAVASSDRLKLLMERTGTGEAIASRELAERAGVAHGTIGALMSGAQRVVSEPKAKAIAAAIGVDLLVLWIPMERAGRAFIPAQTRAAT